jgi:hypothetical protein
MKDFFKSHPGSNLHYQEIQSIFIRPRLFVYTHKKEKIIVKNASTMLELNKKGQIFFPTEQLADNSKCSL